MPKSLQDHYAAKSICFGCGPANKNGLQIKSFIDDNKIIAHWTPKHYHAAFPNVLNGGIIGTLLDCHCNWAAAYFLMRDKKLDTIPCTVTAEYTIKLLCPTPMGKQLSLEATLDQINNNRTTIKGTLFSDDKLCAICQGTFVAVDQNHPGFHRW